MIGYDRSAVCTCGHRRSACVRARAHVLCPRIHSRGARDTRGTRAGHARHGHNTCVLWMRGHNTCVLWMRARACAARAYLCEELERVVPADDGGEVVEEVEALLVGDTREGV
eukprot:892656-Prymnesium_polylepis.3